MRMLYKHPGKHKIHGSEFDYITVPEDEVEAAIKDGWNKTTQEALDAGKPKKRGRAKKE